MFIDLLSPGEPQEGHRLDSGHGTFLWGSDSVFIDNLERLQQTLQPCVHRGAGFKEGLLFWVYFQPPNGLQHLHKVKYVCRI